MPHLTTEVRLSPGPIVYPIVGNTANGGAVNDGKGEAIYTALVGGQFQVWRTRSGYLSLLRENGSVDYLSTIAAGPYIEPATAALQRIGGTVYANLTGKNTATSKGGQWIYRDTSAGKDGSGPWVLHGTVTENSYTGGTAHLTGGYAGGEILVTDTGLWVTNHVTFYNWDGTTTESSYGVATSGDGGATWTVRLNEDFSYVGSRRGLSWSRNFAQFGGKWYVGGWGFGVSTAGKAYSSANLTSWTMWASSLDNFDYPLSTPSSIYRLAPSSGAQRLEQATAAPETAPSWAIQLEGMPDGDTFGHLSNIGSARLVFAAFNKGATMRISLVPTVAPPCRQYPREDGLATSSATRIFPQPRSQQGGLRQAGGTYY